MRISARNVFKGKVKKITTGAVNCEVVIEIAPGVQITSVVTKSSVKSLALKKGGSAYAIIKSSSVMVGVD